MKHHARSKIWNRPDQIEKSFHLVKKLLPEALNKTPTKGTLLDISCGTGVFMEVMRFLGWTVTGTEKPGHQYGPMHLMQKLTVVEMNNSELPRLAANNLIPLPEKSYDVVTCFGAINYIPTSLWKPFADELMKLAKRSLIISFDYDMNFIYQAPNIQQWKLGQLKLVEINHFRWDRKEK